METESTQSTAEPAPAAEQQPAAPAPLPRMPRIPDWRPMAKRIGAVIAALAAVGAVLSGLTGYWSTYKVVVGEWFGAKPAVTSSARSDQAGAPRLSIAVMPFENLSGDPAQDYFGDGIVENLTTDLSVHIPGLLVIARGSAFTYKGQKIEPRLVGRELNVRYLLEGSALRTGDKVRVNARLVDAEDGKQLWADRFDGDTSNIIALQDQITSRIATSLRQTLLNIGARQAQSHSNPDAFDMILRARVALSEERRLGILPRKSSEEFFRKALALEPDNVDAATGLAVVLSENLLNYRYDHRVFPNPDQLNATKDEANELLRKVNSSGTLSSDAHLARAYLYRFDRDPDKGMLELEQARAIDPNNPIALNSLIITNVQLGRPENALQVCSDYVLRTAGKLPGYGTILVNCATAELLLGHWTEAIAKYQQAQALGADPVTTTLQIAVAQVQAGNLDAANRQYDVFRDLYVAKFKTQPTVKFFETPRREISDVPAYLKLFNDRVSDGYRKLGMAEE
jgi:TolB-like protein